MERLKREKAYSIRGAQMGRCTTLPVDIKADIKLQMEKVRLCSGGYDEGGAYWGLGDALYHAGGVKGVKTQFLNGYKSLNEEVNIFVRAKNRDEAKQKIRDMLPNARSYR